MPPVIHSAATCPQGSDQWLRIRLGIPTASAFKRFITPSWNLSMNKAKDGLSEGAWTYLLELVSERYSGEPLPGFGGSWATDQGHLREPIARKWFEATMDIDIEQVAFVTADGGLCGCSPDGLLGENNGLELKCPEAVNHARYVLSGELPDEYKHQVHASMYVTGRSKWTFLSYRDGWPNLLLTVHRDEEIMAKMHEAVTMFCRLLDAAFNKLKSMP